MSEEWTTKYPTKPGIYWIRNYRISIYGDQVGEAAQTPDVVAVDEDGEAFWTGSECGFKERHVLSAEWQGPITPL